MSLVASNDIHNNPCQYAPSSNPFFIKKKKKGSNPLDIWFKKPPSPISVIDLLSITQSFSLNITNRTSFRRSNSLKSQATVRHSQRSVRSLPLLFIDVFQKIYLLYIYSLLGYDHTCQKMHTNRFQACPYSCSLSLSLVLFWSLLHPTGTMLILQIRCMPFISEDQYSVNSLSMPVHLNWSCYMSTTAHQTNVMFMCVL